MQNEKSQRSSDGTTDKHHGARLDSHPLLASLSVAPQQQPHITLGIFSRGDMDRGFSVDYSPNIDPLDAVSQIIPLETSRPDRFKLVLQIANFGTRPFHVSVHSLTPHAH